MILRTIVSSLPVLFFGAAVGCASSRLADDLSAQDHERAASEDRERAREMADRFDPRAVRYVELYPDRPTSCDRTLPGSCSPYWTMSTNPTDRELSLAAAYQSRAKKHRKAAEQLRTAEAKACTLVSLADQDMSPFMRQRDIDFVTEIGRSAGGRVGQPAGAAIAFGVVRELTEVTLQRIVDCQLARNAALGWNQAENGACPLNVRGASAKVRAVGSKLVVDVTSTDASAALEIVKRAHALLPSPSVSLR